MLFTTLLLALSTPALTTALPSSPSNPVQNDVKPASSEALKKSSEDSITNTARLLKVKFLHITDIHPDPYYKVYASTDEESACHRAKGSAGYYGAETSDCDSPLALVNAK